MKVCARNCSNQIWSDDWFPITSFADVNLYSGAVTYNKNQYFYIMIRGKRIILVMLVSLAFLLTKAQSYIPVSSMNFAQWQPFSAYHPYSDSNNLNQKWYVTKYVGISAGFGFFNGAGGSFISAPLGLQLNHPLNNNLIAFAGVSVAPTLFNFSSSFTNPSYPGNIPNAYGLGLNSQVNLGLMYINDAKTFSISGSIGVDRYSYPVFPAQRQNIQKNNR